MIPSGVLLLALGVLIMFAPAACRKMTPEQQRQAENALLIGCAVLLLVVTAAGVLGLRHTPL